MGGQDSGLSEDHGSTGSSGSTGVGNGHCPTSTYRNKHLTTNSVTGNSAGLVSGGTGNGIGLKNSSNNDKVRRSSTDSARSSVTGGLHLHDDLDLRISPHNFKPSDGTVAGADDVSDGSRPGTPLCDERPPETPGVAPAGTEVTTAVAGPGHKTASNSRLERLTSARSTEPMSLPLPKFATQMLANQIQSASAASSAYLTVATSKKDPRLKSPAGSGGSSSHSSLSVSTCLKSPPPSLKSPGLTSNSSRIIPEHMNSSGSSDGLSLDPTSGRKSIGNNSSSVDASGKPHDPRLGLLSKSKHVSSMNPALVNNRNNTTTNSSSLEIEDISDSDREDNDGPENSSNPKEPHEPETDMATGSSQAEVSGAAVTAAAAVPETNEKTPVKDPADMTLEERLKALDEKYQKWSGNSGPKGTPTPATPATPSGQTKKEPVLPTLAINNSNASGAQGATPKTCQTPVSEASEIKSLNSASTTATSGGSSGSTGSATTATPSGGATSKFSFDLKPTQPSPIVQKLLARKSIFDEDTKRLENLNSIDEPTENSEKPNKTGLPKDSQDLLNCKQSVAVNDQLMTVGSVNFGSSSYSNNISATPTEPSSIGANPGERFKLDRSMSVLDQKQQQSTPVRPMLNKLNSVQNLDLNNPNSKSSSSGSPQVVPSSNPAGAVSIKNSASGLPDRQARNNSNSTTSNSALVPSTPPIIGQVRPVAKPGLNPGILTASSVTTPIKPLVDNKIRPLQVIYFDFTSFC